jgi:3-oxoacyl-[acyl-carrier protein] reductase
VFELPAFDRCHCMSMNVVAGPTVSPRLAGKIAVVTGASRGIGRAVARRLAAEGATLILQYGQRRAQAEELAAELRAQGTRAVPLQADLQSCSSIRSFYAELAPVLRSVAERSGIDILVNSAGVADGAEFEQTDEAMFDRLFATNVKGVFYMIQGALPLLEEGGRVINLSSVGARTHFPNIAAYAATKGAVNSLTVHLAALLGLRGITVNAVAPGVTDTDMNPWLHTPEGAEAAKAMQALKRVGMPEDIADAVAFLASPDGRWVTGGCLEVSGGMRL